MSDQTRPSGAYASPLDMGTARTIVGCLAEDFSADLGVICRLWLQFEQEYYQRHPDEVTANDQRLMDVAESFAKAAEAVSA